MSIIRQINHNLMHESAIRFFKHRCISTEMHLNPYVEQAAELVQVTDDEVNRIINENIDRLQHEPVWSVLHDMYRKCHEFAGGSLALFLVAQIGSAEALCRTSIESSVNLIYASFGDDVGNVMAYFRTYIATERSQNKSWLKSVEGSHYADNDKSYHKQLIQEKERCLDLTVDVVRKSFGSIGINYDTREGSWPSTFDRFKHIGKEIEYRTIYAALCSQAHNDPEDILNNLMSRVIEIEGYSKSVEIEQYTFSLYMVLTSIAWYIEASAMYLAKYQISVTESIVPLQIRATKLLLELQANSKAHIERPIKSGAKNRC